MMSKFNISIISIVSFLYFLNYLTNNPVINTRFYFVVSEALGSSIHNVKHLGGEVHKEYPNAPKQLKTAYDYFNTKQR